MGQVIRANAAPERVEEHVRTTLTRAAARGGEIAEAAQARLSGAVAAIDSASALLRATADAEATGWALVLAEDAKADRAIGAVRDAMWNTLGRPKQSPALDQVFPGGVRTYTAGDPLQQPVLMEVLRSRVVSTSAPQWSEDLRTGWASEIETLRLSYAAAVEAHRPTDAARTIAEAGYRTTVRSAHARLVALKRDFLSLGLTEAQIHEIIPDDSKPTARTEKAPVEPAGTS